MKRYRDCKLICNKGQSVTQLLDIIEEQLLAKSYRFDKYNGLLNNPTISVTIKSENLPVSRVILIIPSDNNAVEISNIVPKPESGVSQIGPEVYNQILDKFSNDIFVPINQKYDNRIITNTEDYSIKDIIPKSYGKLKIWLSAYPLSSHPMDTYRWYDFVISLHKNNEALSTSDFGDYLKESTQWDKDTIWKFELRLESHLDLLEYYDSHR